MIENRDSRSKDTKATGILIPLLILAVALLVILLKFPSQKEAVTPQKEEVYFSFDDFHNMIGGNDHLAISQKKELFAKYVGRYVNWVGELTRIDRQPSGDFILRIKHLPATQDYDVSLSLDPSHKEKLERIQESSIISYSGRLFRFEPPSKYFLLDGEIK